VSFVFSAKHLKLNLITVFPGFDSLLLKLSNSLHQVVDLLLLGFVIFFLLDLKFFFLEN
jgi:hypothetical protein